MELECTKRYDNAALTAVRPKRCRGHYCCECTCKKPTSFSRSTQGRGHGIVVFLSLSVSSSNASRPILKKSHCTADSFQRLPDSCEHLHRIIFASDIPSDGTYPFVNSPRAIHDVLIKVLSRKVNVHARRGETGEEGGELQDASNIIEVVSPYGGFSCGTSNRGRLSPCSSSRREEWPHGPCLPGHLPTPPTNARRPSEAPEERSHQRSNRRTAASQVKLDEANET